MKNNFIKNFIMTSAGHLLVIVFGLANSILITRWLGPENKGIYTVVMNIVLFFNLLLGEGLRRSNTIIIAQNKFYLKKLLKNNLYFLFVIIIFNLLFLLINRFLHIDSLLKIEPIFLFFGLAISTFSVMWLVMQSIYLGLKDIYRYNLLMVLSTFGILVLNLLGILIFSIGLSNIFLNILFVYFLIFSTGFYSLNKYSRSLKTKEDFNLTKQVGLSFKSTLTNLELFLTKRSSIFFLNNLLNSASVGIFSVALLLSEMFQRLPNIAGTLIFSNSANKDLTIVEQTAKVVRIITFFLIIIVLGIFAIGENVIILLYGLPFADAFEPLLALSFGLILFGAGTIIHSYYMGKSFPAKIIYLNSFVTILALALNYFIIKSYSILGAGISTSIALSVWSILYIILFILETKVSPINLLIIKKEDISEILNYFQNIFKKVVSKK